MSITSRDRTDSTGGANVKAYDDLDEVQETAVTMSIMSDHAVLANCGNDIDKRRI